MAVRSSRTFIVALLTILAVVASSCAQSNTPGASGAPGSSAASSGGTANKRTINVIANWGGGERAAFQKVIDAFTA
ncbi:MAG TPA: hypothetical protein VIM50_03120, partial [Candidatus Limnocylindria bacterium]